MNPMKNAKLKIKNVRTLSAHGWVHHFAFLIFNF